MKLTHMKINLVVTRHPALVQHLRELGLVEDNAVVLDHVEDPAVLIGRHVAGVLPHSLSALCASFTEVPLRLPSELRGIELSLEQLREHVGLPVTYQVRQLTH